MNNVKYEHQPHQETIDSVIRKDIFLIKPQVRNFTPPPHYDIGRHKIYHKGQITRESVKADVHFILPAN